MRGIEVGRNNKIPLLSINTFKMLLMKKIIRYIFQIVALVPISVFRINSMLIGKNRAFMSLSQFLALIPGCIGVYLRVECYSKIINFCDKNCTIEFLTTLVSPEIFIGKNVYVGSYCNISCCIIGDNSLIGSNVLVTSGNKQHIFTSRDIPIRLQGGRADIVVIGQDCWIGNGAIIMADIGEGCVVAAGSVVTKPIPPFSIAAGVPARVIGSR